MFDLRLKICTGSYRYGFNGMEKDDEIAGSGNSYTAEFWQYDSRLGRRWNVDPETKMIPSKSPFSTFSCNPLIFIDPNGDLDFYSTKGIWIGTDGNLEDNSQVLVTSRKIARSIMKASNKGTDYKTPISRDHSFVLPTREILEETMNVYKRTIANGGMSEEASLMSKGVVTQTAKGPEWVDPEQAKVDVPFTLKHSDDTWIHSHPLGILMDGNIPLYITDEPSSNDKSIFTGYDVNVLIAKSGNLTQAGYAQNGDTRETTVNFYNKGGKSPFGSILIDALKNIVDGTKSKHKERYDNKRKAAEPTSGH